MNLAESGEGGSDYRAIRLILAIGQIGRNRANRLILAESGENESDCRAKVILAIERFDVQVPTMFAIGILGFTTLDFF